MIEDYVLFARTVALGSQSAAARELRISPGMVSKRLVRLEERLGTRLVNRTTRQLILTDAGKLFYQRVTAILAACAEAENMVAGRMEHPSGRLRISAGVVVGRQMVSPHLASFLRRYPQVDIELDLNDAFVNLRGRDYDLAIRVTEPGAIDEHLSGHLLALNPRAMYCSVAYRDTQGIPRSLEDLGNHALLGATSQFPWHLEGPDGPVRVSGRSLVRTNASEVVHDLLTGGLGIALRSPLDVGVELAAGELIRVLPEYRGAADLGVFAVHLRDDFVPAAVNAFIAHLQPIFDASALASVDVARG